MGFLFLGGKKVARIINLSRKLDEDKEPSDMSARWQPEPVKAVVRGKVALHRMPNWSLADAYVESCMPPLYAISHVNGFRVIGHYLELLPMRRLLRSLSQLNWHDDPATIKGDELLKERVKLAVRAYDAEGHEYAL